MKRPKRLDFTPEEIEALLSRIENQNLNATDFPLLADLIRAMVWMGDSLKEKSLSILRLKKIFGIRTESAKKLKNLIQPRPGVEENTPEGANNSINESSLGEGVNPLGEGNSPPEAPKNPPKGHGHRPSSDYQAAELIRVAHETLKKGSLCPECGKGKLFNLSPGSVLHVTGQPWLNVRLYKPERLRCPVCQKIFTAKLPKELYTEARCDKTAKAIVSVLKYRGGMPFYRQEQIQTIMGNPISDTEIWNMTKDVANCIEPVFLELCRLAANSECIHNDDTTARILELMKENEVKDPKRKGIFTTGLLAKMDEKQIALFFTGRKHAGENLNDILVMRDKELPVPIQACDALSRNTPQDHATLQALCNSHARRNFYEIVSYWPKECINIVSAYDLVFLNDRIAKDENLNPQARLEWHQAKSEHIMVEMKLYCQDLIDTKQIEPNSSFGKAIQYLKNHWEGLTLFLRNPGVPISNNDNERLLKRAVLNRKNSYFFKNEAGAKIGDILLSVIETCVLNKINPYNYLISLQENVNKVWKNPKGWLPWNYIQSLVPL